MLDACFEEALIDGQLRSHDRVIGRGEDGLDPGRDEGFGRHLNFGGGGAVLFNVLDALAVAECLGICDGLSGSILAQVVQQADGVDVRVDGQDEVHDGVGVQGIGSAGDVLLAVKTGRDRVGDRRVDNGDVGILDRSQHGGGGGGSHGHDDVHVIGHKVGADLVQVGLVGLRVGVVVGIIKGHALFLAHLIQTALNGGDDLVQRGMVHIIDDAHLEDLARFCRSSCRRGGGAGCGAGGSGRGRTAAASQAECRNSGSAQSGLEEIAAGDHVHGFHSGCSFPGAGGSKKDPLHLRNGSFYGNKRSRPCVFIHKDRIENTILRCHLVCSAQASFWLQSPSRRANTPLPCNGGFRPKLLKSTGSRLPGPRRPTNSCPALARFHPPGSLADALCRFSSASSV